MSAPRLAVLLDGEYVRNTLKQVLARPPLAEDIVAETQRMERSAPCAGFVVYRIYYYTAEPIRAIVRRPLDGQEVDFSKTEVFEAGRALITSLQFTRRFAVRRGALVHHGWQIGRKAGRELQRGRKHVIEARDIVPRIEQKGVDMRIGLDIATLALKRIVDAIVLVTGDADLVPAIKLARREGLQVFVDTLGAGHVRSELRAHADEVLTR